MKAIGLIGVLLVLTSILAIPAQAGVDYRVTVTKGSGPGNWDIYYCVDVQAGRSINKFGVGIDVGISAHYSNYDDVYYDDTDPNGGSPDDSFQQVGAIDDDPAEEEPLYDPATAAGSTSPAPNGTCSGILEWTLPEGCEEGYYFFGYNITGSYRWVNTGWFAEGEASGSPVTNNDSWYDPVGMNDGPVWTAVPEPATVSLLAIGGLAILRKRKK